MWKSNLLKTQSTGDAVIKKNNYRAPLKLILLAAALIVASASVFISNLDLKAAIDNEVQEFQSKFDTFSSPTLLIDNGSGKFFKDIELSDIPFVTNRLIKIVKGGILDNEVDKPRIELFIKFDNFEKIYADRERSLLKGIRTQSTKVPCKISDGVNIYRCKIRLKGDLPEHWYTKKRLSLKVEVIKGYIHGMRSFSIQKPRSRQFPYDQAFHEINTRLGNLSHNQQKFLPVFVNGESWGKMNIEQDIDQVFLEGKDIKRHTIFRISDQQKWEHDLNKESYDTYFLSDPRLYFKLIGKKKTTYNVLKQREIYSYVGSKLLTGDGSIFDREKMIANLALGLTWGSLHTLFNSNAYYTWNDYTHLLEPVLTDQEHWRPVTQIIDLENRYIRLPFEYKILFDHKPLTLTELFNSVQEIQKQFNIIDPIEIVNEISLGNYKNNREFEATPIYANLKFISDQAGTITTIINENSVIAPSGTIEKKPTEQQIKELAHFIRIVHFSSGKIKIYNLTNEPVYIDEVRYKNKSLKVEKFIQPSALNKLNAMNISIPEKGFLDNGLTVIAEINGIVKASKNDFSLLETSQSDYLHNCKENRELNCILSGSLIFDKTTRFNQQVRILDGTQIFIENGSTLIFENSVAMEGTLDNPITIMSREGGAVVVKNASNEASILNHVFIENLSTPNDQLYRYTGAFNGYGGKFHINHLTLIENNAEDQLNIVHSNVDIKNLKIYGATSDAFDCDFCVGSITNMLVDHSNGDGLDVSGSDLKVEKLIASNIRDKALSVGERSKIDVKELWAVNSGTGVASKDASSATVLHYEGKGIQYADFMTYTKKPFFTGQTNLQIRTFNTSTTPVCKREDGTYLSVNDVDCAIIDLDVEKMYSTVMKK